MRSTLAATLATLTLLGACAGGAPHDGPAAGVAPGGTLSLADAEAWERRQRGGVIWVDTGCCPAADADLVVMLAYGVQAAKDLGPAAPFFVTGTDAGLATRVAERLVRNGARHVYRVAP